MGMIDARLDEIDRQIATVARCTAERAAGLRKAIGSSPELGAVLQRTLAAAGAVRAAEGSSISVRRPDGTVATAFNNLDQAASVPASVESSVGVLFVPPYPSRNPSGPATVRISLTVPLGPDHSGSLSVYSHHPHAFDAESVDLLTAIARQAAPVVRRALSPGDVTGLIERPATENVGDGDV